MVPAGSQHFEWWMQERERNHYKQMLKTMFNFIFFTCGSATNTQVSQKNIKIFPLR